MEQVGTWTLPVLRRGPASGTLVILVQPLFEEQNRCRRFLADVGTALAQRSIGTALPDLPGTGDYPSAAPFDMAEAAAALLAFADAQRHPFRFVTMRGGNLLLPAGTDHMAIAPVSRGERLLADLLRVHALGERERTGGSFSRQDADRAWASGRTVRLAGYDVTPGAARALAEASAPAATSSLSIGSGAGEVAGPLVWRQADPVRALETASVVAASIAEGLAV